MSKQYVEERDQGYWVKGTRVSLASIVYAFLHGQTAESIAQSFPVLQLEQVYGAIAYYLANRAAVDAYLGEPRWITRQCGRPTRDADPAFYQKLADARRERQASRR